MGAVPGYRVDFLFDVWQDLKRELLPFPDLWKAVAVNWCKQERVAEGLTPAEVARQVVEHALICGDAPKPPARLDRIYDAMGGVFVSFRDRDTNQRYARDGFWHLDPGQADLPRDLVLATMQSLNGLEKLNFNKIKIGVTLCGALERIQPRGMDFQHCAIFVRGPASALKMGGALPNTQYFTSEIEQFFQAWRRNANLSAYEPFELYRHKVEKSVEPGCEWLPYGAPPLDSDWETDPDLGARLLARVNGIIERTGGDPVNDDTIPCRLFAVAVTLFHRGVLGCIVSWDGSLDECLVHATEEVLTLHQNGLKQIPPGELAFSISLLHHREIVEDPAKLRLGLDSLAVQQANHRAIFLPFVATYYNLSKEQVAGQLLQKAGIQGTPEVWATFQTASWLHENGRTHALEFGFPRRSGELPDRRGDIEMLAEYLARQVGESGMAYAYDPFTGSLVEPGPPSRILHAANTLQSAGEILSRQDLVRAAAHARSSILVICADWMTTAKAQALIGLEVAGMFAPAQAFVQELRELCRPDGSIAASRPSTREMIDHDFLPGQVLLGLANYAAFTQSPGLLPLFQRCLHWYRRRYHAAHPWGMVSWHLQCWKRIFDLMRLPEQRDFVFEIADRTLEWQTDVNGAFLTDLDLSGPTFHTACVLEGIAEARKTGRRAWR